MTTPLGPFLSIPLVIPSLRSLAELPTEREAYARWREQVMDYRRAVIRACAKDVGLAAYQKELANADPAYFLTMFGTVWEPRRGGELPFILYPHQLRLVRTLDAAMEVRGPLADVVIEKARDMGITSTTCGWALHGWLFKAPFSAGLVSRNEALVDAGPNKGTDSMFAKIDFIRRRMPDFMHPPGWDERTHRLHLFLVHPENPNTIIGEATTKRAGRGHRNTVRINDEAAFFDDLDEILAAEAPTTEHRITLSSASIAHGSGFYRYARAAEREAIATHVRLEYRMHPDHTEEEYLLQKSRLSTEPEKFAREYDIDYMAGSGEWVYPITHDKEVGEFPYVPGAPTWCSIDPGVRDLGAVTWIQYLPADDRYRVVRAYQKTGQPAEFWASLLTGLYASGAAAFDFSEDEIDLMEWAKRLGRVVYVGDPAVNQREAATATSFNDQIRRASSRLYKEHGKAGQIHVQTVTTGGRRFHGERIRALRELLLKMDFNRDPHVAMVLNALRQYHFPFVGEGKQPTREMMNPVHDEGSHYVSTLEFLAVNLSERPTLAATRLAPIVTDSAGRLLERSS